jgi:hypothetical protein
VKKLLLVIALLIPFALHASPDKEKLKKELAAIEDAFCAMAQQQGLLAAFSHFAAPDVAFIDTEPRKFRGHDAVRERIGPDQPGVKLTWAASFTDVSDDGTLGYNYGRYESRRARSRWQRSRSRRLVPHNLEAPARRLVALRHGQRHARPATRAAAKVVLASSRLRRIAGKMPALLKAA